MSGRTLWYLTRGTGVVSLLLLTAVVAIGILSTFRWRSHRLPRFVVAGLHRNLTLTAIAFVVVHVVTTIADSFAPIGLKDAVLPFLSPYRPIWLGLGTVAFDLLLALTATSLLRARVGLRLWRGLHWLAYAAWPIALVHSLGTGTDARIGWMQLLAAVCTALVALAVLARIAANLGEQTALRLGAGAAAVLVPLGILLWARSGPLQRGWAARAGTPAALLASARTAAAPRAQAPTTTKIASSTLPAVPFSEQLTGRLSESPTGTGLVTVGIDAVAQGALTARLHVVLRGYPIEGGGVTMTSSRVSFGPAGAPSAYTGRVVALRGGRMVISLHGSGAPLRLSLELRISSGNRVSGVLRAERSYGEQNAE